MPLSSNLHGVTSRKGISNQSFGPFSGIVFHFKWNWSSHLDNKLSRQNRNRNERTGLSVFSLRLHHCQPLFHISTRKIMHFVLKNDIWCFWQFIINFREMPERRFLFFLFFRFAKQALVRFDDILFVGGDGRVFLGMLLLFCISTKPLIIGQ